MDSILPERLLALVRPAFDLVLRRIRSLKRCVQACGCKIMTPRYACKMPSSCVSARQAKKTGRKKREPSQTSQKASQEPNQTSQKASQKPNQTQTKPARKPARSQAKPARKPARSHCQTAYLGVIILQPQACTQRFTLQILCRTRSNAGRTSARSLAGRTESIRETPSKERSISRGPPGGACRPATPRSGCRLHRLRLGLQRTLVHSRVCYGVPYLQ